MRGGKSRASRAWRYRNHSGVHRRSTRCPVCGKIRYATPEAALARLASMTFAAVGHAYRCAGWWHISSN